VPQGAVLSPLLFAIFLDPLLSELESEEFMLPIAGRPGLHRAIHSQLFADDVALGVDTRCTGWERAFQRALDLCAAFAAKWRLAFSTAAGKSAVVHFRCLNSRCPPLPTFHLAGHPLLQEVQYKFLGVILHERLSWRPHFEYLLRRARFAAFQVQRLIPKLLRGAGGAGGVHATDRRIGGPHFPAVRALVLGAVYARATYGVSFMSGPGVPAMLDRLEAIAVLPLRAILGLPRSAHTRSILIEADIPPVQLFRQQLLLSFARRCMEASADHPSRILLLESHNSLSCVGTVLYQPRVRGTYFSLEPCRAVASGVKDYRRPLLYDILEAEHRWQLRVLQPGAPLYPPLQAENGQLSCVQLEQQHGAAARVTAISVEGIGSQLHSPSPSHSADSVPSSPLSDSAASNFSVSKKLPSLSLRARQLAFSEWKAAATGGQILAQVKTAPGRSLHLYLEPRPSAVLRTRLRFDRAALPASLCKRGMVNSPLCQLHPQCRRAGVEGSVEHSLLHCPALADQQRLRKNQMGKLSTACSFHSGYSAWKGAHRHGKTPPYSGGSSGGSTRQTPCCAAHLFPRRQR